MIKLIFVLMYEKIGMIVLIIIAVIGFSYAAFGENYTYNMTKNETDQIIISELCYSGIDLGECKLLYGGINTQYGEPLK